MLHASWAQQGGHRRESCQFHSPAESLPCLPSFKHHLSQKQAYETWKMRNSAVTGSKYCFGLETVPYRTNFVQTCCILCLKKKLEVFVFHLKTSWIPFFPWLHFVTIYLHESNLHWTLNINNTIYYWKIVSCFNIWLRITRKFI